MTSIANDGNNNNDDSLRSTVIENEEELLNLIKNKVSLKEKTIKGLPPIIYATSLYDEDLACDIVNNGVDVDYNVRHDYGYRPLHYACEYGMVNLVQAILIKMKKQISDENTFAKFLNNTTTIDLQLQMKSIQGGGKTFLHFAALASEPQGCEIMEILVNNYGANVNVIDWDENTPAILAAMHKHTNSLNFLLSSSSSSPLMKSTTGNKDNTPEKCSKKNLCYTTEWLTKKRKCDYENGNKRIKKMWSIHPSLKIPYSLKQQFTFEECDYLLKGVKEYTNKNGWLSDRHRGYATTDVRVNKMPKLDKWLKNILRNRLFPILSKNHKFAVDTFKFRDLFFVYYNASDDAINKNNNNNNQHNKTTTACLDVKDAHDAKRNKEPQQRSVGIHRDGSVISFNVLLNSENDFVGGGTFFEQDQVVQNNMIITKNNENDITTNLVKMEGVYGKVYTIQRGDVLIHSGKLRHGGYEITNGKRMLLVGFVDAGNDIPLDLHFQDHH